MSFSIIFSFLYLYSVSFVNGAQISVSSSEELSRAIQTASAGDVITLGDATYTGNFVASQNGPITIKAARNAQPKVTGSGTAFTILGNNWQVGGFEVSQYSRAIVVKGKGVSLSGIMVKAVENAIEVEGNDAVLNGIMIMDAKNLGIRLAGSNFNLNSITIQVSHYEKPALLVENSACCGNTQGCSLKGSLIINGNKNVFKSTMVNMGGAVQINGCGNSITRQMSPKPRVTSACSNDIGSNSNMFTK